MGHDSPTSFRAPLAPASPLEPRAASPDAPPLWLGPPEVAAPPPRVVMPAAPPLSIEPEAPPFTPASPAAPAIPTALDCAAPAALPLPSSRPAAPLHAQKTERLMSAKGCRKECMV